MKSKEVHIVYWLEQAEDDWEAVSTLLSGKNIYRLYFLHIWSLKNYAKQYG